MGQIGHIFLSTKEVAELTGWTTRHIQRKCQVGEFSVRERKSKKGNIKYAIALSSLPQEAQAKYSSKRSKAVSAVSSTVEGLSHMPEWKRKIALERFDILKQWEQYAKERGQGTSGPTLYRWKKRMKKGGVAGLAPNWHNGKTPLGDKMFSPEAKKWVHDFWLHPNMPSMKLAYTELQKQAFQEGWKVPSYTSVKKLLNTIPEPVQAKHRRGSKFMNDRIYPYLERDNTIISLTLPPGCPMAGLSSPGLPGGKMCARIKYSPGRLYLSQIQILSIYPCMR
jgi:hypothetical protein